MLLESSIKKCTSGGQQMSKGEIWNWQMHPGKEAAAKKSGQRIQIWGPGTFWCLLAWIDFWKHIYLGSRFIQNGLFLARPDPMNHVWGADLSESPNIPPVVAKAPSQCGRSFKTRRQKLSKHKILLVANNGQKRFFFKFTKPCWCLRICNKSLTILLFSSDSFDYCVKWTKTVSF